MVYIIILSLFFKLCFLENVVLPFKKITIENLKEENKAINDLLYFNNYAIIQMGTPPKNVLHLLDQQYDLLTFKKFNLSYDVNKYNEDTEKNLGDLENNF